MRIYPTFSQAQYLMHLIIASAPLLQCLTQSVQIKKKRMKI